MMNKPDPKPRQRPRLASAVALSAVLSAALCLSGCERQGGGASAPAVSFHGVDMTGADYARTLSLPDVDGKARTLADFKGKVVFVFFGFTQCPDICPTTMAELAEVRRRLGPDGDRVQGVFVTVDPERDTPEVLKAYLEGMDPGFVGLRGTLAQTEAVARDFKVFFQKVPSKAGGGYTMDHTAGAYIFDPAGHLRLFVRYGTPIDDLTADIKTLLSPAAAVTPAPADKG